MNTRSFTLPLALAGVAVLSLVGTGCEKLKARDQLNQGVRAFTANKFPEAVEHFKEAVALDPTYPTARLYLATAYMSQWIPGADSEDNNRMAKSATDNFLKVLEQNPQEKVALASLASLNFNQGKALPANNPERGKKLDEAKAWNEKLIGVDPKNKEAYYSLGVITWEKWYPAWTQARTASGMKPEDPGPLKDKKAREELKATWGPQVESGIQTLQKALDVDKEYDDAMAYMNLLIRERADLADTPDQYKRDVDTADSWVQRALETKKIKAQRAAQQNQGIVMDQPNK